VSDAVVDLLHSPADRLREDRIMHEAKLAKMEAAMKDVFREKVELQEAKLKQSEVELYARHKDIKDHLSKQWTELMEKKKQLESVPDTVGSTRSSGMLPADLSAQQRKKTFRG
jgi:septin family protein